MNTAKDGSTPSSRLGELSRLNVLFCLLVVFIHVASHPVSVLDKSSWQYLAVQIPQRLAFVSVSGFFFLSGLKAFLHADRPISLKTYYRKRAKAILLPYLIAVCVYDLVLISWGWEQFDPARLLRYCLLGDLSSHFYFVVTLVQFILLFPLWQRLVERYDPALVLPFALLISLLSTRYLSSFLGLIFPDYYFPYSDRVFPTYLIYYLAGCYAGREYGKFLAFLEKNRRMIQALFCFFTLSVSVLSALHFSGRAQVYYLEELHMGYQLSAILFLFSLAAAHRDKPLSGPVKAIDRVSYLIYLYHCLAILVFQNRLVPRLGITKVSLLFALRALFVYGVTVGGCLLWRQLAGRVKKALPRNGQPGR